jgi:four helix bundle protein
MPTRRVEDFFAYECAVNFKEEVHRIVRAAPEAYKDFRYRSELWDATDSVDSNIAEGFHRGNPGENANFLRYSLASLAEARRRLANGVSRGYFEEATCATAFTWADRCKVATARLMESQVREQQRRAKRKRGKNG